MKRIMMLFLFCVSLLSNAQENYYNEVLNKATNGKLVHGTTFLIAKGDSTWMGASGDMITDTPFFIASTTKLFTTTIILQMREDGKISLDDPISKFIPADLMKGLHVIDGVDYSEKITIRHLLAQTSGLPDYFQGKKANGKSLRKELTQGVDQHWTFEEAIALSKTMKPKFAPGAPGKAFYSDTNFQLLGKIIEVIGGSSYADQVQQRIAIPLSLKNTYVYADASDNRPVDIYYKKNKLHMPKAMTSFGADGGIVSTTEDLVYFLQSFFDGSLFPEAYLQEMKTWNKIFYPLEYGVGLSRFKLNKLATLGKPFPELIGHSGLSGTVAFYDAQQNRFIVGTVNQIHRPSTSYKVMVKLLLQP